MEQVIDAQPLRRRRSWPKEGYTRVPAWIYSDEEIYRRELEHLFGGNTWSYVGLACELAEVGSYKRAWIGERQVIAVRDEDGINVVENRCAHRSSAICWKDAGKLTEFTCPYHQWSYSLKGDLLGVPLRRGVHGEGGMPASFDAREHGLNKLRVVVRGGSIWATFSRTAPEFADYCGAELMARFDRIFEKAPLRLVGRSRQIIPSNWKLYLENSRDPYHATLLHTFFITFGLYRADNEHLTSPVEGGKHSSNYAISAGKQVTSETSQMKRFNHALHLRDMEIVGHRDEFGDRQNTALQIFPSAFIQQHANVLAVRNIIPRGVDKLELSWTYFGYADDDEDLRRLRLKQANLVGPGGLVSLEDSELLKPLQKNMEGYRDSVAFVEMGGTDTKTQYSMATEVGLRAFYDFYRKEMGL